MNTKERSNHRDDVQNSAGPLALRPEVPVLLLVGGMGTRLRPVLGSTVPKPLAPLGDKPFLNLLIHQLRVQGFRHVVMCTGYGSDQIKDRFGDGHSVGIRIDYSPEPHPLGTAGAVRLAREYVSCAPEFLVMNGDSFLDLDLRALLNAHGGCRRAATMALSRVSDAGRYGTVQALGDGRVIGFAEKTGPRAPGIINAGVYAFDRSILDYIPEGWANLEQDVFPRIAEAGVFAVQQKGIFIDIGVPEDYSRAQALCAKLYRAASKHSYRGRVAEDRRLLEVQ
ncbi:MAG: nucleotidyltransferase family protein [Bryobacteraceae bacterium]